MGLDITAYREIKKVELPDDSEEVSEAFMAEGGFRLYHNSDFPGRSNDVPEGYYTCTESDGFRAGSYGGYNAWREQLAQMAGYPKATGEGLRAGTERHDQGAWNATEGPFWEMIAFSDCEGVLGTATCAKLAKDFADWQERAEAFSMGLSTSVDDGWFMTKYAEWRAAFELASDGGALMFH